VHAGNTVLGSCITTGRRYRLLETMTDTGDRGGLANVRGRPSGVRGRIGTLTRGGKRSPELLQPQSPES